MSQALLFIALHLVGTSLGLAATRDARLGCAAGFPLGLATGVLASLAVLGLGLPYSAATLGAVLAVIAAAALAVAARRGHLDARTLRLAGLWTLAFAAVACAASAINISILSYDSHALVLFGGVIGRDGLGHDTLFRLNSWGVFVPVAHSWAVFLSIDYLWALAPVLGLSFVPLYALILDGLFEPLALEPRRRHQLVALVATALFTVFFFHHHFVYIHNNVPTAIFLAGFVGLMLVAEGRRDGGLAVLGFVLLAGCALMRVEAPVATLLLAALLAFPSRLPRAPVGAGLAVYAAAVSAWYLALGSRAPATGQFLTAARCYLVVALMAGAWILWWFSRSGLLARVAARAPEIIAGVIAAGLAVAFALAPAHMAISARSWFLNLIISDYWGLAWPLLFALAVLAGWLPSSPAARTLGFGVVAAIGLIILFAFGRDPYRAIHVGDSANRMMLHLLPLIVMVLGLRLAAGLAEPGRGDQEPVAAAGAPGEHVAP